MTSMDQFNQLTNRIKKENWRKRTESQCVAPRLDEDLLSASHKRSNSVDLTDPSELQELSSKFVQNPGFCAESAPSDNIGNFMSWFQSDWEQRNVGKSPIGLHTHVDSLFSSTSGFNNFRGLLNLGLILLVVSNIRVALENLLKYGILASPLALLRLLASSPQEWPCFSLLAAANAFAFAAFGLELLAERGALRGRPLLLLTTFNMALALVVPTQVILERHPNPMFSSPTLAIYIMMFLKLWSYHDVNAWCRRERRLSQHRRLAGARNKSLASALNNLDERAAQGDDSCQHLVRYPHNLTLGNLYYFLLAPTLCYELNYPKILRVRRRFLAKRCVELLLLPLVAAGLVQQWIVPTLNNSLRPLGSSDWPTVLERLLKLAVPNHIIWLLFFYSFFHSALNVIGELLLFGDRCFYRDWWNSESISTFWSLWNVPVHRFAKRHVFAPLLSRWGVGRLPASVVVFAISAFFHELLVSVPLRMFRLWAFSAMILQVPLAVLVNRFLRGGQLGNMAVWASLILGQPLAVLMYFHDYYVSLHIS